MAGLGHIGDKSPSNRKSGCNSGLKLNTLFKIIFIETYI